MTTTSKRGSPLIKKVDGVNWYQYYNNKDAKVTLLSSGEGPNRKGEIVLQHWGTYKGNKDIRYAKFDTVQEAFNYIYKPKDRKHEYSAVHGNRFFEYIRDGAMRPFFDIDMSMDCCSKSNTRRAAKVVAAFIAALIECFEDVNTPIDASDFRLYESCGQSGDKYKYSYHIVITSIVLCNIAHVEVLAKMAAAKASILLGDLQYLLFNDDGGPAYDLKIYSSLRAFRLIGSSKDGATRIKKPFVDSEGERVIIVLEDGKVQRYTNDKVENYGQAVRFSNPPEVYYDYYESLVMWYGNYGFGDMKHSPKILGIEYFTPPAKAEYICENKNFDVELVAEKFFEAYPELEGVYKLDRGSARLSARKGDKTCPCGGVHDGTGGGIFQSRGKKGKPYRYVFWCYQCSAASEPFYYEDEAEEAEENEWKTEEEIEAEKQAEEEEKARILEKKEAMEAEKIGRVKANYIIPDEDEENPEYITRESYTGFRERVDAPVLSDYLTERTEVNIAGSSEKSCARKLGRYFCKLAQELSPFYKVSQFGDLMQYKNGEWKDLKATATKYTFPYTVNAKEPYEGKVVVTASQILTGSFLNIRPFNKLDNEIIEEAEAEWVRRKTRLPTIQCRYNYFKGQPVPLYNSRCVNVASGFQAVPIFTDDYSEIEPLIEHIKYSHCAGNEEDFDAFMKVKAYPMVNTQNPKSQRCPIIVGVGNCLKTQIYGELMMNVYGNQAAAAVRVADITADKNGILDNKVYLYFDEPDTSRGSKDNGLIEVFKRIITARNINIRKLYNEGKPTSNVANLLVTSNTFDISFVDRKDMRRFIYLKAKVMAMLSNGVRIVASDETYGDVTYMKGGELSAEDKALLIKETEAQDSSIVTKYHNWMLDGLAGGQGHKSQRCADLFAGWLITNYGHIKFKDLPIQSLKAESRKEALKSLTGQVHKFFAALTGEDYNWYSLTKPYLIKAGGRKGKYYISKSDIYQEFREFRKATSNGHSYDEAHFMTEFYSLVDRTDQIERCYRQWGDKKDNRITINKKKVAAGFYIAFADGLVIRDDLSPFNSKNRKLPTRNAAAHDNKNTDEDEDEDEDEDFSKPKTKTPEPVKTEEDDYVWDKKKKTTTAITEVTKIPTYNVIPADIPVSVTTMLEQMQQTFMLQMQKQQEDFMKKLEEKDKEHRKELKAIKAKK